MADPTTVASRAAERPSRRLFLHATAIAALILFLLAALTIGPYLFAPNHYEGVPSIERRRDYRDPALMSAAWALPVARTYAHRYEYQANPSYCGPASVANLLRSTGIATSQDRVIDDTRYEPWFGLLIGGLTIDEVADLLAQRVRGPVRIVRDPSLPEFRAWMRAANDPSRRMIVNFHRGPLFGRGHGHFSPVLGYLADRDLVLVGDVNADYRPFLVGSERLWQAADTVDDETGKERGLIIALVTDRRPRP